MRTTFPRLLLQHATQRPQAPALREKEYGIWQTTDWRDLAARVQHIAGGLHQLGLRRGEHLVVIGANRPNLYARRLPIAEMNVTPFIDVLLVLLIMLILAIPMAANVTPVDLPHDGTPKHPVLETNVLTIDAADRLAWNGFTVSVQELRAQVAAASALEQQPMLRFAPDALASYATAARTIALIREEGAESFTFVGNDRYRNF